MTIEDRLLRCFAAVFPDRPEDELVTASADSLPEWDSLTGITLLTILQDEFDVEVDLARLPELDSYPAILDYVRADSR